jgi:hypothetical protein
MPDNGVGVGTTVTSGASYLIFDPFVQLIRWFGVQSKDDQFEEPNPLLRAFFLLLLSIVSCHTAFAQAPQSSKTPDGIEEVYLAKDDGNGKAGEQVSEFRTTDVPIYCVVLLGSDAVTVVKMNFVAVNVTGVKTETKVVTASYTTKDHQNRVNFTGRPDGKWTPGKYRVDLFLDGKKAREIEFDIKSVAGAASAGNSTTAVKNFQRADPPKPAPKRTNTAK